MRAIIFLLVSIYVFILRSQSCLVGYYPLDGSVTDSVLGVTGTTNGPLPAADRYGNSGAALYFNGTSSANLVSDYDFPERTVSFWFRAVSVSQTIGIIYENDHAGLMNAQTQLGVQQLNGVNYISLWFGGNNNLVLYPLNLFQWYHIVAVRDTSEIRYYVNCELVGKGYDIVNAHSSYGVNVSVIGNASYNLYYFTGVIDELRLFNCALRPQDIPALCSPVGIEETAGIPSENISANFVAPDLQSFLKAIGHNAQAGHTLCLYNCLGQKIPDTNNISDGIYYYTFADGVSSKRGRVIVRG